jgi:sugar phosphate isomerase/epimerase
MKLGVTLSTYPSKFGPIVFRDGNLPKNLPMIKSLGYEGVDLFVNQLDDDELDTLHRLMDRYELEVAMYLPIFLAENGVNLSCRDSAMRKTNVAAYKKQVEKSSRLGARKMPVGFLRGAKSEDEQIDDCLGRLADSLKEICDYAMPKGITLCLEPINRYEINTLNTVDESLDFIERYRIEPLGLLLDTFHMNIEDRSLEGAIRKAAKRVKHFHCPDSNRNAAGSGHLDYGAIIKALKDVGYAGYLMLEAFPLPDPVMCAKLSSEFLRSQLKKLEDN